jgi:stage V sporulation protein G
LCFLAIVLLVALALPLIDHTSHTMEITRVRIGPSDDERIAAYASITIDDCFVIHGLRVKVSKKGDYYLFMPGKKLADGTHVDIALPIDNGTQRMIEEKVFAAFKHWCPQVDGQASFAVNPRHF